MCTLTIAVEDYLAAEGVLRPQVSQVQGTKGPKGSQTALVAETKARPVDGKHGSAPSMPMLLSDFSDLSDLLDSPLLRSAPTLSRPLYTSVTSGAACRDDTSTYTLWVRMKSGNSNAGVAHLDKMSVGASFVPHSPAPTPSAESGNHKDRVAAPGAAPVNIPNLIALPPKIAAKVSEAQKKYVCLDEVKQVVQAASPARPIPVAEAPVAFGSNTLRGTLAVKLAAVPLNLDAVSKNSLHSTIPENTATIKIATPVAPPLRKLKLSLKVASLTKLYSALNLSSKLVRFAARIANVKTFDGRDSPRTVQNSPSGSPTNSFVSGDYFPVRRNFTDLGFSEDNLSLSDLDLDLYQEFTKDKRYTISRTNFVPPQNIYDKRDSVVYLQQAKLHADKKLLVLLVMCQNLAYEKKLSVKLTFNNWNSSLIYNNWTYVKLFTSVNFDQFQFVIPFSHFPSHITPQFCVRYDVNNNTYWDNNGTKNYSFTFDAIPETKEQLSLKYANVGDCRNAHSQARSPLGTSRYAGSKISPQNSKLGFAASSAKSDASSKKGVPPSEIALPLRLSAMSGVNNDYKGASTAANYKELVIRLLDVKAEAEARNLAGPEYLARPSLPHAHSMSLIPSAASSFTMTGPNISQSYISRRATQEKPIPMTFAQYTVAQLPGPVLAPSKLGVLSGSQDPTPRKVALATAPEVPRLPQSVSCSECSYTNFNSSSYAQLLATYCFNGADAIGTCPMESLTGSRTWSSLSINSDFMGPSLAAFHSLSDSFHV